MRIRIQKILAERGIASRRKCEELIQQGRIMLNGRPAQLGEKADPEKDILLMDYNPIPPTEKKTYILLNKPHGYVCTVTEPFGMRTVLDLVQIKERVYPVGRLDRDSEGLILLTNDGELALTLTHPRYGVEKTYHVRLDRPFLTKDMEHLQKGIVVGRRHVHCRNIRRISPNEIALSIHEGRKHIIKVVFKEMGYRVIKLFRSALGSLKLANLKPGQWRYLSDEEIKLLRQPSTAPRQLPPHSNTMAKKPQPPRDRRAFFARQSERRRDEARPRSRDKRKESNTNNKKQFTFEEYRTAHRK